VTVIVEHRQNPSLEPGPAFCVLVIKATTGPTLDGRHEFHLKRFGRHGECNQISRHHPVILPLGPVMVNQRYMVKLIKTARHRHRWQAVTKTASHSRHGFTMAPWRTR
jgi:hypothetical protein